MFPLIDSEWPADYDDYCHQTTPSPNWAGTSRLTYCLWCACVQRRKSDLALFHAVPRPNGEVRQARSREPVALLRSACDGLAAPVQSPTVVDIMTIALLSGLAAMSITIVLPAYRRVKRQTVSGWKSALPPKKVRNAPSQEWVGSGSDQISRD